VSVGWNSRIEDSAHAHRCGRDAVSSVVVRTVEPPAWCVDVASHLWLDGGDDTHWRMVPCACGVLLSARVAAEAVIDDDRLAATTTMVYLELRRRLERRGGLHPVRFWNFIPGILRRCDRPSSRPSGDQSKDQSGDQSAMGATNRYMRFNEGRFAALEPWLLSRDRTVAATGVGNAVDGALVVHCLALGSEGRGLENPAQVPALRYSRRFGPMPPAFARATWLPTRHRLLVSGTASVLGEESVGIDLPSQLKITIQNLRTIARDPAMPSAASWGYESLRAYVRNWTDAARVRACLANAFREAVEIEVVETELCRPELLVEIEGLATPQAQSSAQSAAQSSAQSSCQSGSQTGHPA